MQFCSERTLYIRFGDGFYSDEVQIHRGGETTAWWLWSNMVNQLEANADCKLVLSLRRPRVQRVTRQPTTPTSTPPINTTRARWFSHQHQSGLNCNLSHIDRIPVETELS